MRRLFLACWLIFAVHWAPFMIREEFPAITLATDGTLNVARFEGWTSDIFARGDGRAFINNNPGASILGAVPLFVARPLLERVERWNDRNPSSIARSWRAEDFPAIPAVAHRREWYLFFVGFLTSAGLMAPVSALTTVVLARALIGSGTSARDALLVAATFAFATPVFQRTGYLNHNLLVTHAGLLCALTLWNTGRSVSSIARLLGAGALGGLALLCDYSGGLVTAFGGIYAMLVAGGAGTTWAARIRNGAWYTLGALPPLAILAWYQWWAFGSSVVASQQLMPAIEQTSRGFRGMDWPSWRIAMMNFFDPRFGLFVVCPILVLAPLAWLVPGRMRVPNRERAVILAFSMSFVLFCAANQYSELQWTTGIRYLVPIVPGVLLLALQVLSAAPRSVAAAILIFSVGWSWLAAVAHNAAYVILVDPTRFQAAWAQRMTEYGALAHPVIATVIALSIAAITATLIARGAVTRMIVRE